jgi:hypothetical protein
MPGRERRLIKCSGPDGLPPNPWRRRELRRRRFGPRHQVDPPSLELGKLRLDVRTIGRVQVWIGKLRLSIPRLLLGGRRALDDLAALRAECLRHLLASGIDLRTRGSDIAKVLLGADAHLASLASDEAATDLHPPCTGCRQRRTRHIAAEFYGWLGPLWRYLGRLVADDRATRTERSRGGAHQMERATPPHPLH